MGTSTTLEHNKANVQDFYDLMFNGAGPPKRLQGYAGEVYVQHNPHVGDGKQAFIDYFERIGLRVPRQERPLCALLRRRQSCDRVLPPELAW